MKYGIERSFASDVVVGGPTYVVDLLDDPGQPLRRPVLRTRRRTGSAWPPSRPPTTARSSSGSGPRSRTSRSSWRCRRAARCPSRTTAARDYGVDPVSSGPYAITSVDVATGILLERNPEWDPATDDVRTALPDRVVVRTGLSGLERDQAVLAGSADIDLSGTGVQPATTARLAAEEDNPLRERVDGLTNGAVRMLALPTDVAPMDNPACRAAVAAAVDRRGVQESSRRQANAVRSSRLWPRALPAARRTPTRAPDLDAARAALQECGQPDGFATVLVVPTRRPTSRSRARWPASSPRSASRRRSAPGRRPRSMPATSGIRRTWRPTGSASSSPPGRRTSRRPGRSWCRSSTDARSATSATPTTPG